MRSLYETKTHLSELVDRAARGEEIIISKNGVPMARLAPLEGATRKRRKPGGWEGRVWVSDDFDAPLPVEVGFESGPIEPAVRASAGRKRAAPRKRAK
ncbi:MAG: type II toxin-antitoxin system prevent-host-death family antitoxin [Deltaproteobacteria bacterium]|nr:type II toxin-antitoxin system prevent-host-death family antitoxin [Deltaproteobacteria bacterium]